MSTKINLVYMKTARLFAELSYAKRRQVGCVIVKDGAIIAVGYNGTPAGWDNNCEHPETGQTLPEVIHAEQNALDKIIRSSLSSVGSSVFVTTAPCMDCAKRLFGAGVQSVYFEDVYRNEDGLHFLRKAGIYVEQIKCGQ